MIFFSMTELWPNLCGNVGKKEEGLFCAFLRMNTFIGDVCRRDHSNQNLMVSNNI